MIRRSPEAEALLEEHTAGELAEMVVLLLEQVRVSEIAREALTPRPCSICRRSHGPETRHAAE